uniref:Uncharacterized protein n=1 Tax=Parascaris univalens TaxID=6257 RepID=A0A915BTK3_PARUN
MTLITSAHRTIHAYLNEGGALKKCVLLRAQTSAFANIENSVVTWNKAVS